MAAKLGRCWQICTDTITVWVPERVCWCLSRKTLSCQLRCSTRQSTHQEGKAHHLKVNLHTF